MATKLIIRHGWQLLALVAALGISFVSSAACTGDGAQSGLLGLDRCDEREATGIFSRRNQQLLNAAVISGTLGVALWEGTQSLEGRTAWKSLDSMATTAVV